MSRERIEVKRYNAQEVRTHPNGEDFSVVWVYKWKVVRVRGRWIRRRVLEVLSDRHPSRESGTGWAEAWRRAERAA